MSITKTKQLELFREHLPYKPYCSDDPTLGVMIRSVSQAVSKRHIQPNPPTVIFWIPYDIDRPTGKWDWRHMEVPPPNIVTGNPENGHAHLLYGLEWPVSAPLDRSERRAYRYLAAVDRTLGGMLQADPSYGKSLTKNPLHDYWDVNVIEPWSYTLDGLAEWLDLSEREKDLRRTVEPAGLGRNCSLFDWTRLWAYQEIRGYWGGSLDHWTLEVRAYAGRRNHEFVDPLPETEIRSISKSVAEWTWERFTPAAFSALQAARGRKSGEKRRAQADERRQQLLAFMDDNPGASQAAAAEHLGVRRETVNRMLKHYRIKAEPGEYQLDRRV